MMIVGRSFMLISNGGQCFFAVCYVLWDIKKNHVPVPALLARKHRPFCIAIFQWISHDEWTQRTKLS